MEVHVHESSTMEAQTLVSGLYSFVKEIMSTNICYDHMNDMKCRIKVQTLNKSRIKCVLKTAIWFQQ